jgi:cytosine/adenosine deaminase-related metal-dependent hydrolase
MATLVEPTLIRNATSAIVLENGRHVYRSGVDVRLQAGRIADIATGGTIRPLPGEEVLDASGHFLIPGLIDIHAHPATEPGYRGIREDHGVPEQWMTGLYERTQAFKATPEGCRAGQVLAYCEMLSCGVTTVCDLSVPFEGWIDTMRASGMRVYGAAGFASGRWGMASPANVIWAWDEAAGKTGFERAKKLLDQLDGDASGRLAGIVYPMQIDTVTEELFREAFAHAEATGRPFMSHMAQTVVEVREMIRRHGISPVAWAARIGILAPRTTMGHCIFLDEHPEVRWSTRADLSLLAETGMTVAHCPSPFARYGAALESFARYRAAGVNIALGTDVAPHNLVEEMRLAIQVGRVVTRDVRGIDAGSVFEAATLGAAKALQRHDIGRIAVGARADLVLVDLKHPLMQPARDPLRSFVYHAADRAVRMVLVDGRVIWRDGRALGLDRERAVAEIGEQQARMCRDVPKHDHARRSAEAIAPLSLPSG